MENYKKRSLELITGLAIDEKPNPAVIPFTAAKTAISGKEQKTLPRCIGAPEKKYVSTLLSMLCELEAERRANIHSIMVLKDGCVILEASHPGYSVNTFHLAHSMSKTVTAIAIGLLYDEGRLDLEKKVTDIFPEMTVTDRRFKSMTVEHLLSMKSGVQFAEVGTVTEEHWCEAFFASHLSFAPGESFAYNSMNSYILGKIVTRITGKSLSDYITPRLLAPLEIENFLWEIGPEGIEKGGFGVYLSCESFAKIGLMLANGGIYGDSRILSEEYVALMTATHSIAPIESGAFNYGYHIWVSREGNDFLLNGMLGQNVWINPDEGIVVSINAGNNELFQDSPALGIVRKHLLSPKADDAPTRADLRRLKKASEHFFERRHWIRPLRKKSGLAYLLGLKDSRPFDEEWCRILGSYALPQNNISLLPTFVSVMQNNYSGGLEKLTIERNGNGLLLSATEGGVVRKIPVGLYDFAESVLNYNGESYIVKAMGEAMEDEDRNPVYKIELIFPELPNRRMIKITEIPGGIRLRLGETPDEKVVNSFMASLTSSPMMSFATGIIEKKAGADFISKHMERLFHPELPAINIRSEGWEELISAYNRERAERREGSGRLIKTIMSRFTREERGEQISDEEPPKGGFLSRAINSLLSKTKLPELIRGIGILPGSDNTDED